MDMQGMGRQNSTCKIRRDRKESICLHVTQCHASVPGDKVPVLE